MTPKEKAQDLFNKFYDLPIMPSTAKDCALIAVEEILKEVVLSTMYWQEVKQEIQAL